MLIYVYNMYVHMYTYMYVYIYVYRNIYMHMYALYIYIYTYGCACTYTCTCTQWIHNIIIMELVWLKQKIIENYCATVTRNRSISLINWDIISSIWHRNRKENSPAYYRPHERTEWTDTSRRRTLRRERRTRSIPPPVQESLPLEERRATNTQ